MTLTTISLNGTPIEDLGLDIASLEQWHTITDRQYAKVQLPLRRGSKVLTTSQTVSARTLAMRFIVNPTSFTDRATRLDALAAQFNGLVTVTTADAPSRAVYGLLQTMNVTPIGQSFVLPSVYADCSIVCDDPLWYDVDPVVTAITAGTQGSLVMGTGPVRKLVVTVNGAVVNPVVILRDQTATEVQRMTLTGSIAAGKWVEIDCDAYSITLRPDGTNLLQAGWLGVAETFFELRQPFTYTLECSGANLTVEHFRSYET